MGEQNKNQSPLGQLANIPLIKTNLVLLSFNDPGVPLMANIAMLGAGSLVFCKTLMADFLSTPTLALVRKLNDHRKIKQ